MFVCSECGSDNLMIMAWIDPNTNEIIADVDECNAWCDACQKEVRMDIDKS